MNGYLQSALVGALFLAIGTSLLFIASDDELTPYHGAMTPKAVAPSETEITREAPLQHTIQGAILVTAVKG